MQAFEPATNQLRLCNKLEKTKMPLNHELLETYLQKWHLIPMSEPFITATSLLQTVKDSDGNFRMLKITQNTDEINGIQQLQTWSDDQNDASVQVFKADQYGILLNYAEENRSLLPEALTESSHLPAMEKLAKVIQKLHQTPLSKFQNLRELRSVFQSLFQSSLQTSLQLQHEGKLFRKAQIIARDLLDSPQSEVVLHGDAHHGNALYFSPEDIRMIDPKGFCGEHYFDYLPIFMNPDLGNIRMNRALFEEKIAFLCYAENSFSLEKERLLQWIFAGTALSASWFLEDEMLEEASIQLAFLEFIDPYLN
ncbi:aminoglycoside phosphotransferase family protein [Ignatzschineria sp. LJL83]